MKRISYTFLLLLVALGVQAGQVKVASAAEFKKAVESNHKADILLVADIDGSQLSMFNFDFGGSICGLGNVDGRQKAFTVKGLKNPLFKSTTGARVSSVAFSGARVASESESNLGVLAKEMNSTCLENVAFSQVSVFSNCDNAGAVAGTATGCTFKGVVVAGSDITVDGNTCGGLVGSSAGCIFKDCLTDHMTSIFADGTALKRIAQAGGLCGLSARDTFTGCVNGALVGANDDRAGGLAGYAVGSTFLSCRNMGCVFHAKEGDFRNSVSAMQEELQSRCNSCTDASIFGGGMALLSGGLSIVALVAAPVFLIVTVPLLIGGLATVAIAQAVKAATGHDDLGGLCGLAQGGSFSLCENYGACYAADGYVGGICGRAEKGSNAAPAFTDCLNAGEMKGKEYIGGLVGLIEGGSIKNSLNIGNVLTYAAGEELKGGIYGKQKSATCSNNYTQSKCYNSPATLVSEAELRSGQVAVRLNGQRTEGPWRQNIDGVLDGEIIVHVDGQMLCGIDYPVPNSRYNAVSPDEVSSRNCVKLSDDGSEPEAIGNLPSLGPSQPAAPAYDLQGRATSSSARGLHVRQGRKVMVR